MDKKTKIAIIGVAALTSFYIYFNRNPDRVIQSGIVSPADGTVEKIENNRIDIFIGITDVHVQRAPVSGIVEDIQDYPNENKNIIIINGITIERKGGILARNITTEVNKGDYVEKGQIIGRIKLGSHTSIYPIYNPIIQVGNHVIAGQTIANM